MNFKQCLTTAPHCAILACAMLTLPLASLAQQAPPKMAVEGTPVPPGESMNSVMAQIQAEIIGAAEAMPADKYDFVPTGPGDFKGVRSFAAQVKHLTQANYEFFEGWGIAGAIDPKSIDSLKTKDEIVKALRTSFAYADSAIGSITPQNAFTALKQPEQYKATRASTAAFCMEHAMDHYGQLVEYLRMNGIVPPASRPGAA